MLISKKYYNKIPKIGLTKYSKSSIILMYPKLSIILFGYKTKNTKKKEVKQMATKFVGYVPDVKEFADANGKTIKINRVRLNMVDDNALGCIGQDVQYYMVKKEDLQRVCGVKEFEELRQYLGYKAFISMTLDVRSQKPVISEIGFMKGN